MIQPRNRHISFFLYISALAVLDTIAMLIGKSGHSFDFIIDQSAMEIITKLMVFYH